MYALLLQVHFTFIASFYVTRYIGCNKQTEIRINNQGTPKPDVSNSNSIYRIRSASFSPDKAYQQNPLLSSQPPLCNVHSASSHNIIQSSDNPTTTTNACMTNPQKTVEYVDTIPTSNCERILTHLLKTTKKNLSISPFKGMNKLGGTNNNRESSTREESDFIMPTKVQNYPQLNLEHTITPEEEENIKHALQNYVLFQNLTQEVLSILLHELFYFTFDKNKIIYEQGDEGNFFYILADGKVKAESKPELNKQNNITASNPTNSDNLVVFNNCSNNTIKTGTVPVSKVYSKWECFGGLSLISKCKREETLTSVTEVAVFCLDGEAFREVIRRLNELRLRDRFNYLNTISVFQPLGNIPKYNVATKLQTKQYKPNEKIIVYGTIGESLYTIKSGLVSCRIGLKEVRQLGPSDYFGQNAILVDMKRSCDVVALTDTVCYEISRSDLKDALGDDYRDVILLSFFTACVNENKYFKDIFIESKMNALFALFKVHRYTYKERLVDNKLFTSNNRLVLLIDGSIYKEKEQESGYELYAKKGDIIGESQIKLIENTLSPFLLAYPDCITFEANVEDVCKLLDIIQQPLVIATKASYAEQDNAKGQLDLFGRISKLKKVCLFQNLSEKTLETIAKAMNTKKFILNETIVKEGTVGDTFYLISQGRVQVTSQGKKLRELDEGNYFGEVALLDPNEKRTASIVAIDDTVILYEISKKEFDLLIVDNNIKTHMKTKLALQITSIELKDLFYIKFLGKGKFGNVNLVHNTKHIYAIKAVSRREVEKQNLLAKYFINERRVMLGLDHPFIIKLVKTLKDDFFCFFLLEYVNGTNLDEYVSSSAKKRNVYTTQFYIGSMLVMLEYLQNKMIAHRDIKLSNVMVNSNGYLKMIDFGTAKVLNDYTNTVIGTPHYISPEILQGKGYSLSCDFWSVGICMYEIFYGAYPFGHYANDVIEIYKDILHKELVFPSEEARYDKVNSFMKDVLKKKVNLRICSVNLLKGKPFFEGFEWDKLIEFKLQPPYVPEVHTMDGVLDDKHKPFVAHLQEESAKIKDKRFHYHDKWADEF